MAGTSFVGSIQGTILNVTQVLEGEIQPNLRVAGAGVAPYTVITANGTGSGGLGTYSVSVSQVLDPTYMEALAQLPTPLKAGSVNLYPCANYKVIQGGQPTIAAYAPLIGGYIQNPLSAKDQGLHSTENLYVDLTKPAVLGETSTCTIIPPGGRFQIPSTTINVTVTAATTGHRFFGILIQEAIQTQVTPYTGEYPPNMPSGLMKTIPSYLYKQFDDDEDLQAFVLSYNDMTQNWLDWFNQINLPIYTGPLIAGTLLDWVGSNLYGQIRPALEHGKQRTIGELNTWCLNTIPLNQRDRYGPITYAPATDEIYKRVITWNFYKGDGKVYNARWLKRRVMRFLIGAAGTAPPIPDTYQVSVSMGEDIISIRILTRRSVVTSGAILNTFCLNTTPIDSINVSSTPLPFMEYAPICVDAINQGVLLMPLPYSYQASIT